MKYIGLRHFTYNQVRVEPGRIFPKIAARNNHWLEERGYVEEFRGREEDLIGCQECPGLFIDLPSMQKHRTTTEHKGGEVIRTTEGIRTAQDEQDLDEVVARMPKEGPGFTEVGPNQMEVPSGKRKIKRR